MAAESREQRQHQHQQNTRTHAPCPRRYYVQLGSGMSEAALCAAACAALGAKGFSVVDVNTAWLPGVARLGRSLSERQMLLATLNHPLLPPVGPASSRVPAGGGTGGGGCALGGRKGGLGVAGASVGPNTCTQLTARPRARRRCQIAWACRRPRCESRSCC